jgi:hypothetical protein
MPGGSKNVIVTVTVRPGQNPAFVLGGDVNGNGAVVVGRGDTATINWSLNGSGPNGTVTFASIPIEWMESCNGKTSNPWPSGPPAVTRTSSTTAQTTDVNSANHAATLEHLYKINVVYGGVPYSYDPEVDEQGGGVTNKSSARV